jgi:selenocysteine lyase/cysteine desulfurase
VRVSTHFYNTPAEVLRLVESLNQIASRRAAA